MAVDTKGPGKPYVARRPPLRTRLAILYYAMSFGLFTWIWVALIALSWRFPAIIPVCLA